MPDHYTYASTEVLVNRRGYTDPALWKAAERRVVHTHMADLTVHPIPGSFDLRHLQAIHAALVDGFYDWGGRLRDTDTGPGGTGIAHCRPEYIPGEATRIFTALAGMDYLRGRTADQFSKGLAWVWGETTVLHPFRDINTRSQFVFFNQLAADADWVIDWNRIDPRVFAHARTVAIFRDEAGIDALLHPALIRLEEVTRREDLRQQIDGTNEAFFARHSSRSPEQLDTRLQSALERRRRNLPEADDFGRHGPSGLEPPGRTL
ncbi:MAG: hypothetical protein EPN48_11210 [Microbacteriaceae bacterium]|nr:MAG: hypothetical protein EPN48_11210 [Microbacteriaceae bacterium]